MKKIFLLLGLVPFALYAQIGINNPTPTSTLDITAKNPTGTATTTDGILIPRIDRERAQGMTGITASTLVYINDISTGNQTGTTIDVSSVGFYYFDGTKWVAIISTPANNDWKTVGNTGTNPANNFIGTTDNQPVIFKVNNTSAGMISTVPLFNTSFGLATMPYTATGQLNTAIGFQALMQNTSGNRNTAVGAATLSAVTTGISNTALGFDALATVATANSNTGLGYFALRNATGASNIGLGYQAGFDANTGGTSVSISSGQRNLMLGINTGIPNPAGNDQMNIGNIIFGSNINGTLATPKGNVGIGTSSPTARVEIASGTNGTSGLKFTNINNATPTTANAAALGVDGSGNVVIQNIAPLTTSFKSFSIDANSATNSLITIGSLEFRYPSTTCAATASFMQVRSTTGANNLGVQHARFTTAQDASGFVNTTPLTATPTFANITAIPLNCVQDGHAQFNFFSYTDRTFYRVNVHVADGDSQGFGALGYIFVELQR